MITNSYLCIRQDIDFCQASKSRLDAIVIFLDDIRVLGHKDEDDEVGTIHKDYATLLVRSLIGQRSLSLVPAQLSALCCWRPLAQNGGYQQQWGLQQGKTGSHEYVLRLDEKATLEDRRLQKISGLWKQC